jgi:hypothetical protein
MVRAWSSGSGATPSVIDELLVPHGAKHLGQIRRDITQVNQARAKA